MTPAQRAEVYVRTTRKLNAIRDDLEAIKQAEMNDEVPGGRFTLRHLDVALDAIWRAETDYRGIALGFLRRAGQQPPLF